jgi:hypothetical protein
MTLSLANLIRIKYVAGEGLLLLSLLGYIPHVLGGTAADVGQESIL